jgi:sugar (pentulose or hexulose) kinase
MHYKLTGQKVIGVGDAAGMFPIDSDTLDYNTSMVEIFLNDGEEVLTSRFYVEEEVARNSYRLQVGPPMVKVWDMKNMQVDYD